MKNVHLQYPGEHSRRFSDPLESMISAVKNCHSTETLQARREWHDVFKVMKEKNLQPRILYPARLSFRFDEEIKSFPDNQK